MWATKERYDAICDGMAEVEPRFLGGYPEWPTLDRIDSSWTSRLTSGPGYALFYIAFATRWWQFLFLPFHFTMGPLHGALLSWFGHRYGYRDFNSDDDSHNTLALDIVTLGELFQSNHHKRSMSPNFAVRWFEIDPAYQAICLFLWRGILQVPGKRARSPAWSPRPRVSSGPQSSLAEGISLMPEAQDREKAPHRKDRPLYYQLSWCRGSFSGT
jgi:stearoyl-CoA desaturase (Delta-9 desaturase)